MLFYASLYYPWIFISSAEKSPKLGDFFNTKSNAERDKDNPEVYGIQSFDERPQTIISRQWLYLDIPHTDAPFPG